MEAAHTLRHHRRFTWLVMLFALAALGAGPAVKPRDELVLTPIEAFAIGARIPVRDVRELDTDAFNDTLRSAQAREESWTRIFLLIALRFEDPSPSGSRQSVDVNVTPSEWHPSDPVQWVRITIENHGWLDDSVAGDRTVLWLAPAADDRLVLWRALRASECSRPGRKFYSAKPCP
jgi:hypothetical protein